MNNFSNNGKWFLSMLNKMIYGLYANFLWLLFSLPIITIGASTTALFHTVRKTLREERGYIGGNFFETFRSKFKKATKIWMLLLAIFAFLFADFWITSQMLKQGAAAGMFCYFFLFMMLFASVWSVYIFAYAARMEGSIKETMKNAGIIAIVHWKTSLLFLVILIAYALALYLFPIMVLAVPVISVSQFDEFVDKIFRSFLLSENTEENVKEAPKEN